MDTTVIIVAVLVATAVVCAAGVVVAVRRDRAWHLAMIRAMVERVERAQAPRPRRDSIVDTDAMRAAIAEEGRRTEARQADRGIDARKIKDGKIKDGEITTRRRDDGSE